jgi:hypothetical protein
MNIKYKTIKVTDQILVVRVKNNYDRAMLFCRAQEFYESQSSMFKGKKFSIWDYFRWYSQKNKSKCFSYTMDFSGFNMPMVVAKKCYEINNVETPYDEIMKDIVDRYFVNGEKRYLIGVDSMEGSTFDHEMCHAMYYVCNEYRMKMDEITESIGAKNRAKMKRNLSAMGYCNSVFKDEVQAYMSTEANNKLTTGVGNAKKIHKIYKSVFRKMKPIL